MSTNSGHIQAWADQLNALGAQRKPCFFLMDFEQQQPRVWDLTEDGDDEPRFDFPGRPEAGLPPASLPSVELAAEHLAPEVFRRAFQVVQDGLQRGDSFLTNLTFPTPVKLRWANSHRAPNGAPSDRGQHGFPETPLTEKLAAIYWQSEAKYRILLPGNFVCFSPETFVTVNPDGYIESRPMKGTALDTIPARSDLLNSHKEIAEHATIVDLIRNDLSQVAKRVRVTDYRYFHKITTSSRGLVQTSSNIGGQLPTDWKARLGTILTTLLPAGSVSGAPKPATLDIIRRAEPGPRGYYCGIGGYFDGRVLDTCVLIRFIEKKGDSQYYFRSGGGITARSKWQEEYAELKAKIRIPGNLASFSLH